MKPLFCIFLSFLLHISFSFGQETSRKTKSLGNGDKEIYHVLTSDKTVLHGKYLKTGRSIRVEGHYKYGKQDSLWQEYSLSNGKFLRVEGYYKDGLKDGLWTVYLSKNKLKSRGHYIADRRTGYWKFYNPDGEIEEEGNFNDGVRTGIWTFYDKDGSTEQQYNYTTRDIVSDISLTAFKGKKFRIIDGTDTTLSLVERPPLYIGGMSKIRLPRFKSVSMTQDSAKVEISFTVNNLGYPRDHSVVNSTDHRLDKEAMMTVQQLYAWIPAMLNGKTVDVEYILTVSFKKVDREVNFTTSLTRDYPFGDHVDNPLLYPNTGALRGNYTSSRIRTIYVRSCLVSVF